MASKRNCVKSFEIHPKSPRMIYDWMTMSLIDTWYSCNNAMAPLRRRAQRALPGCQAGWEDQAGGGQRRNPAAKSHDVGTLIGFGKWLLHTYILRLDLANSCIFKATLIRREEVLMGGRKAPGPSWTSWSPTHWHEADTNTGILKSRWWFSIKNNSLWRLQGK